MSKFDKKSLDFFLRCPMCSKHYSDSLVPLVISCGHSICKTCYEDSNNMTSLEDAREESDDDDANSSNNNDNNQETTQDTHNNDVNADGEVILSNDNGVNATEAEDENKKDQDVDETKLSVAKVNSICDFVLSCSDFLAKSETRNATESSSKEKKNNKFRVNCPGCREAVIILKDKTYENKQVLDYIALVNNLEKKNQKNFHVYCSKCKIVDKNISHIDKFPDHKLYLKKLDDFKKFKVSLKTCYSEEKTSYANYIESLFSKFTFTHVSNTDIEVDNKEPNQIKTLENGEKNNRNKSKSKSKKKKKGAKSENTTEDNIEEKAEAPAVQITNPAVSIFSHFENFFIKEGVGNNINTLSKEIDIILKNKKLVDDNSQINKASILSSKLKSEYKSIYDVNDFLKILHGFLYGSKRKIPRNFTKQFNSKLESLFSSFLTSLNSDTYDIQRKFMVGYDESELLVLIFDARIMKCSKLPFQDIMRDFTSTKLESVGRSSYSISKHYTKNIDIDSTGRYLYIIGKEDYESKKFKIFDIHKMHLMKKQNIPAKVSFYDGLVIQQDYYILGFINDEKDYNTNCFYFSLKKGRWINLPSLGVERKYKTVFVVNDTIYVALGIKDDCSEDNNKPNNIIESLNLDLKDKWVQHQVSNMFIPFNLSVTYFVDRDTVLFFGGDSNKRDTVNHGFFVDLKNFEKIKEKKMTEQRLTSLFGFNINYRGFAITTTNDNKNETFVVIDMNDL